MIRPDISVIPRKASITILTKDNQMTFSPAAGENIYLFSTAQLTPRMFNELEKSKVVEVESCTYCSGNFVFVHIQKKFGFTNEILTDLLVDLIEKNGL